jgi:hypothetical protein
MDTAYWDKEVSSFRTRLATLTEPSKVRMLLRGLAVMATEITREEPDTAEKILADLHACLREVHDNGIALDIEGWLRSHASEMVARAVEQEFKT